MVDQEKGFKAEQVLVAPAPAYLEDTGSQVLGTSKTQYESSRHLQMIAIGGGIGLVIGYWDMDTNICVWITVFLVAIVAINIFGILGYGEEEFWSSSLKLAAVVIFMIIALVCVLGGGPKNGMYSEYWGARFWYDPGAFRNGFKGFCSVFVTAAFAFSGTELVGFAAAESNTPVQSLPSAVKQIFWRISLFYILALFFVGPLVPYDDTRLLGSVYINVKASPFVIVAKNAGLIGFDHFMNVVILVSVLSIGNSSVYGGSRTLTALAEQEYAPRMFSFVDLAGPARRMASLMLILYVAVVDMDAETFFKSYLAAPIVMFFWVCGYLWKGQGWLKLSQIDVDSGRREIDWEAHNLRVQHMCIRSNIVADYLHILSGNNFLFFLYHFAGGKKDVDVQVWVRRNGNDTVRCNCAIAIYFPGIADYPILAWIGPPIRSTLYIFKD
ncbi:hypothetical protein HCAG_03308 [Histoplasma mississippiense (nom. inval.)]|uniref:hypothetical protein n=1 Tax=Ajellomyces capsulatus (strain NAm1 / WU24) TaxID=2059318 RepID=UPI000157BF4F|nr:hypothetical protein HCAG_03308 [Histoplasma mississippiense (nom. inval.)]EDN06778.1 hypothetical protein HCAG_03308 [Histoplasma mississippiense (nom. inval.)]